eukprot:2288479-Rhodomonas_salina.1
MPSLMFPGLILPFPVAFTYRPVPVPTMTATPTSAFISTGRSIRLVVTNLAGIQPSSFCFAMPDADAGSLPPSRLVGLSDRDPARVRPRFHCGHRRCFCVRAGTACACAAL